MVCFCRMKGKSQFVIKIPAKPFHNEAVILEENVKYAKLILVDIKT